MTGRIVAAWAFVAGFALPSPLASQTSNPNPLVGAWRVVMYLGNSAQPLTSTPVHPAPRLGGEGAITGLRLFTREHYSSQLLILGNERPPLPDSAATAAQLLATWGPFSASTGRYELRGDTVIATPLIAKNPRITSRPSRYTYRLRGDSLFLMISNGLTEVSVRTERGTP